MMKTLKLFVTALALMGAAASHAQTDLQNTGVLYLTGSPDILYVTGSFTNASGAALTNNGNLYVQQNLSNSQSSMTIGTGTLYLNGSAAQTVSGAQPFKTYNLVTNNAAGILLNNNLSVTGAHTFTSGVITTSITPNYLVYEAGSSYTGDGNSKHVNGWIQKNGATAFTFPLGNGTVERTIGISSLSASSVFNANYAGATTNTSNVAPPLVTVDRYEYWIVNQVSGGTAVMNMNWDNSKVTMPGYTVADIRVANYTGGLWTQKGGVATGNVTTTGNISSNALSSFGPFTFGSVSFALPVNILQFTAYRSNGATVLNWTTSEELNVSHYEAERSDDGISFYNTGNVAARNSTGLQQYGITDNKALKAEITYYRLKSVDIDGKITLSKVVSVRSGASADNNFTIVNPVHGSINISAINIHDGEYTYKLITNAGQTLQSGRITMSSGSNYQLPLSSAVAQGIYILELHKADYTFQQRIVIQ